MNNSIHTPQDHRNAWLTVNLLLAASALFFLLSLSGCMTYERAVKKYGHMAKDSIHVTVRDTVVTRKDSVVTSFRTDTTTIYKEIQQGKAKVIVERTHTQTTIKATCEPDTIYLQKIVTLPPVVKFGVAPWFKKGFLFLLNLVALAALIIFLLKRTRKPADPTTPEDEIYRRR